jgi:hypothetical protein
MPRHTLAYAGVILGVFLLGSSALAQEYYGVPIEDGGVAFLLDVSGSMMERTEVLGPGGGVVWGAAGGGAPGPPRLSGVPQTSKMELARRELLHALGSLKKETNFTIITFGNQASEWPERARPMGSTSIALARMYVANLSAGGGTAMAEALRLGFNAAEVRTLFVVSDGRPTTGDVLWLAGQLQQSRKGRRMVINTVGIGRDQDSELLCRLARDNEGVYVRDREVACTFSPCSPGDGLVTFYPPDSIQRAHVTRVCSGALHPDCTAKLVYETMLSEALLQTTTRRRAQLTDCLELDDPPTTIVLHPDGLEATNYTRPGNPAHPGKIMRIVKQLGDDVVVETTGAGKLQPSDFDVVDLRLIEALNKKLAPVKPRTDDPPKKTPTKVKTDVLPKKDYPKSETNPPPKNDR